MPGLEELFAYGSLSKEFNIGNNKVRLNVLDAKHLQDALNASYGLDDMAKLIDFKKQVLARSITFANGVQYIENAAEPTKEEITKVAAILGQFHVIVINKLYDYYDELDGDVKSKVDAEVKKSLVNRGASPTT